MVQSKKKLKTKHKKRKISDRSKRNIIILFAIIIIFLKLISSKTNIDMKLILNYVDITPNLFHELIRTDDVIYMSMEDIAKYIDSNIYQENNLIITTSDFKVACIELGSNVININGSNQNIAGTAMRVNEIIYLPISDLEKVYNIKFNYSKLSNISIVENLNTKKVTAIAKKKISIKKDKNIFSKTLSKVKKEETLTCISEEGKWTKVMDNEGNIGFVKTGKLKDLKTEREKFEFEQNIQNDSDTDFMEEDITNLDIETFDNRKKIIENVFTKAIENERKYVKLICKDENRNIDRLKIEALPIFNECGITIEFSN